MVPCEKFWISSMAAMAEAAPPSFMAALQRHLNEPFAGHARCTENQKSHSVFPRVNRRTIVR